MSENLSFQASNEEYTEVLSEDENAVQTGETCSQVTFNSNTSPSGMTQFNRDAEEGGEGSYDPDATCFRDVNLLQGKSQSSDSSQDLVEDDDVDNIVSHESNLSYGGSQESSQPITPLQDIDRSPAKVEGKSESDIGSVNETFEFTPSQDIQNTLSPTEKDEYNDCLESQTLSLTSTLEAKPSSIRAGLKQKDQYGLCITSSAVSTSSSSSQIVSSSSSSKRTTESDDTDDIVMGSQDIFGSHSSSDSQNNVISVSQFVPTLQLSGDLTSSQGYARFVPNRLCPSSPTSGLTSTPLKHIPKISDSNRGEVISLSDEEDVQKLSEKRKLSDSSDESKPNFKRSKKGFDSRQSVEVVREINSFKKPFIVDTQDHTFGSQGISLHLSESDPETPHSLNTEMASPLLTGDNSRKTHSRSRDELHNGVITTMASTAENDVSVVSIDDIEDEVLYVSPQHAKPMTVGEITLDSSGHADIEVLTPLETNTSNRGNLNLKVSLDGSVECSPFKKQNSSAIVKAVMGDEIHDLDNSKENLQTGKLVNLQEFETEFIMTFSCTYKVACKTSFDTLKKETVMRSIPAFEILESKTVMRRDSSPSAVEESSPGRGGGSPGSVASGPGPFSLPPTHAARLSMFSTTSSSSAGSAASIYRQVSARRGRAPAQVFNPKGTAPPSKQEGLVQWRELLNRNQDELAASASPLISKWEISSFHSSSSDEFKTIGEERVLDTVPEVDNPEEVLGIPPAKSISISLYKKRLESLCTGSSSSVLMKSEPNSPDAKDVVKTACETPPTQKRKRGRVAQAATPRTPSGSSKKKAPTPRKKKWDVGPVGDHASLPDDSLSSGPCVFTSGCHVFAHWNRGKYYPGRLGTSSRANQWNVIFHDGEKKDLSQNEIHCINTFVIGQSVCAMDDGDQYEVGTVENVIPAQNSQEELYKVKLVSGNTVTVPISGLCLTENQINQLIGEHPTSTHSNASSSPSKRSSASKISNIDLDNILPGKRVRTPKASQTIVNSPGRPGPSNTARRLIADSCSSSTAEDEPLATDLMILPLIAGVQPEQFGFEKTADPLARKGKGVKKSASKKPLPDIDDERIVQELGPIPPEGSRIFAGFSFLLTITDVSPQHRHEPITDSERNNTDVDEHQDDEISQCASDLECYEFTKARMVKDRLMRQISQGGGKVFKHWVKIVPKDINHTYVISNRPCTTAIFLQCLVRGVKCINHDYIIHCCRENKRLATDLRSNILPVGYSLKKAEWISWSDHKSKLPLQRENILIEGGKSFKDFWEEVLKQSGANISTVKSMKGMFCGLTKVLSEKHCSELTLKHARKVHIPIVSPVWVIQSLVENKPLPHDDLQCFAHDFSDCN